MSLMASEPVAMSQTVHAGLTAARRRSRQAVERLPTAEPQGICVRGLMTEVPGFRHLNGQPKRNTTSCSSSSACTTSAGAPTSRLTVAALIALATSDTSAPLYSFSDQDSKRSGRLSARSKSLCHHSSHGDRWGIVVRKEADLAMDPSNLPCIQDLGNEHEDAGRHDDGHASNCSSSKQFDMVPALSSVCAAQGVSEHEEFLLSSSEGVTLESKRGSLQMPYARKGVGASSRSTTASPEAMRPMSVHSPSPADFLPALDGRKPFQADMTTFLRDVVRDNRPVSRASHRAGRCTPEIMVSPRAAFGVESTEADQSMLCAPPDAHATAVSHDASEVGSELPVETGVTRSGLRSQTSQIPEADGAVVDYGSVASAMSGNVEACASAAPQSQPSSTRLEAPSGPAPMRKGPRSRRNEEVLLRTSSYRLANQPSSKENLLPSANEASDSGASEPSDAASTVDSDSDSDSDSEDEDGDIYEAMFERYASMVNGRLLMSLHDMQCFFSDNARTAVSLGLQLRLYEEAIEMQRDMRMRYGLSRLESGRGLCLESFTVVIGKATGDIGKSVAEKQHRHYAGHARLARGAHIQQASEIVTQSPGHQRASTSR